MIRIVEGNLVDTEAKVIIHQTNCTFGFGSGVAKAIKDKWPVVAEKHHNACEANMKENDGKTAKLLGKIQPVYVGNGQYVINMFSQDTYGYDGAKYTSYDALDSCLKKVAEWCHKNSISTIALPINMSCVRGGASWNVVYAMICDVFDDNYFNVEIRKLDLK